MWTFHPTGWSHQILFIYIYTVSVYTCITLVVSVLPVPGPSGAKDKSWNSRDCPSVAEEGSSTRRTRLPLPRTVHAAFCLMVESLTTEAATLAFSMPPTFCLPITKQWQGQGNLAWELLVSKRARPQSIVESRFIVSSVPVAVLHLPKIYVMEDGFIMFYHRSTLPVVWFRLKLQLCFFLPCLRPRHSIHMKTAFEVLDRCHPEYCGSNCGLVTKISRRDHAQLGGHRQETQSVVYSTGCYLIREVSCEFCDNKLGAGFLARISFWNIRS